MSYTRWSSIVDVELSNEEWFELYDNKLSIEEKVEWCKKNKNPKAYLSDWYIFWHSFGGAHQSNKKEDQYLAMWNCVEEKTPVLDYLTVKQMLENDDWSPLGYESFTQKDLLIDCVKRWLNNVEADCE